MSGAATTTAPQAENAWEVTGTTSSDLAQELASQTLPKPPREIIEVSSIAEIGDALDRLQRAQCFDVQLRFTPACPPEVYDFAFTLPKSITEAILRYNEIVAKAGTDATQPSYGLPPGSKAPMIVLRIDPQVGADACLSKTAVVDLSGIDAASASDAARGLATLLERAHACTENPPHLEVQMPSDPVLDMHVRTEMLDTLHKPATDPDEIERRLRYIRKRLELLDLIVGGIRIPGAMLLD
jgi:hypothetical protein